MNGYPKTPAEEVRDWCEAGWIYFNLASLARRRGDAHNFQRYLATSRRFTLRAELGRYDVGGKGELAPVSVPAGPAPTPPAPPDPLAVKRKNVEEIAKAQGYTGQDTLNLARQLFEKPKLKWLELTDMNLNLLQTYLKTNKKAPPLGSDEDIHAAAMEAGELPREGPPAVEQYDGAAYESVDNLAGGVP